MFGTSPWRSYTWDIPSTWKRNGWRAKTGPWELHGPPYERFTRLPGSSTGCVGLRGSQEGKRYARLSFGKGSIWPLQKLLANLRGGLSTRETKHGR